MICKQGGTEMNEYKVKESYAGRIEGIRTYLVNAENKEDACDKALIKGEGKLIKNEITEDRTECYNYWTSLVTEKLSENEQIQE